MIYEKTSATLVVNDTTLDDAAVYMCSADNKVGRVETEARLMVTGQWLWHLTINHYSHPSPYIVHAPIAAVNDNIFMQRRVVCLFAAAPKISLDDKYQQAIKTKAGTTLTLQAIITGFPQPTVTWQLNGNLLADQQASVERSHECSTLRVLGCCREHSGSYTISAENEVGVTTAEITVNITGNNFFSRVRNSSLTMSYNEGVEN